MDIWCFALDVATDFQSLSMYLCILCLYIYLIYIDLFSRMYIKYIPLLCCIPNLSIFAWFVCGRIVFSSFPYIIIYNKCNIVKMYININKLLYCIWLGCGGKQHDNRRVAWSSNVGQFHTLPTIFATMAVVCVHDTAW